MSIFQAFLCGICYYMSAGTWIVGVGFYTFGRALIQGFFTGLILGDPITGTMVGCTIQLIYLGVMSTGGSFPADQALAGIMGTAAAITAGLSAEEAIAIAVPIGLLGTVLYNIRMVFATTFVHLADKYAEEGNTGGIWYANVVWPQVALFIIYAIPCTLACWLQCHPHRRRPRRPAARHRHRDEYEGHLQGRGPHLLLRGLPDGRLPQLQHGRRVPVRAAHGSRVRQPQG